MGNQYYEKLAEVESSHNPHAKAKTSSATGLYQMTRGTFHDLQKRYPWLAHNSWEEHARNPKVQQKFANSLTKQNEQEILKHGHEVNDLNRYLYHFAGPTGANKLLTANPNARVGVILGPQAARANPELARMTVAQMQNHFANKLGVPSGSSKSDMSGQAPWQMYSQNQANPFAEGGEVKPWEQYKGSTAAPAATQTVPQKSQSQPAPLAPSNSREWEDSVADTENPFSYISDSQKTEQGKIGKAIGKGVQKGVRVGAGLAQGAVIDPAMAIAQLLPGTAGENLAKQSFSSYDKFRKNMGGDGFDVARLAGNVVSPAAIKGAQLVNKGFQMWGKPVGLFRQGATQGALAGGLQPVLPDEGGDTIDPETGEPIGSGILGEKAKQVGGGALFGGALNKLIGRGLSRQTGQGTSLATPGQIASTPGQPLTQAQKIEKYRQTFPDADLTWGQALGGKAEQLEQRLTSVPWFGDVIRGARNKALESQNVSMMNKALEPSGVKLDKGARAGREMFDEAYSKLTGKYDDILKDVSLHDPQKLRQQIQGTGKYNPLTGETDLGVVGNRYQTLSETAKQKFDNILESQFFQKFGKDPQGNHSVRMTGEQFKKHEERLKETIDDLIHGTGEERTMGRMLKDVVGTAYQNLQGSTAASSKTLKDLNKAYAQYKTLEKASTASGGSGGVFNPLQTINAAKKGNASSVARGKGLLQSEAELSQDVLGRVYPDSGTAGRLMGGNPFSNLIGGALSLPAEVLYSPKLTSLAMRGGNKLGAWAEGTRAGNFLANKANAITPATTRFMTEPYSSGAVEEGHARGGKVKTPLPIDTVPWTAGFARGGLSYADGGETDLSKPAIMYPKAYPKRERGYLSGLGDAYMGQAQPNVSVLEKGGADYQRGVGDVDLANAATLALPFTGLAGKAVNKGAQFLGDKAVQKITGNPTANTTRVLDYANQYNPSQIFIGQKSPKWNKAAAKEAQELEELGMSAPEIWKKTLTGRGAGGAWRQEIDDSSALMKDVVKGKEMPLREAFKHDELGAAYPGLLDSKFTADPQLRAAGQHWAYPNAKINEHNISLNPDKVPFSNDRKSTILHELQHAIQGEEKFPAGGNLEAAFAWAKKNNMLKPQGTPESIAKQSSYIDQLQKHHDFVSQQKRFKGQAAELKAVRWRLEKEKEKLKEIAEPGITGGELKDIYRHFGGEAEARLTQRRMNLSPSARREWYPFEADVANPFGYDVDPRKLITGHEQFAQGGMVRRGGLSVLA